MATTHRPPAPHRSAAFALDPYFMDEYTFTRGQILRARGMTPRRRPAPPKPHRSPTKPQLAA
jgi:hypothetical protein